MPGNALHAYLLCNTLQCLFVHALAAMTAYAPTAHAPAFPSLPIRPLSPFHRCRPRLEGHVAPGAQAAVRWAAAVWRKCR